MFLEIDICSLYDLYMITLEIFSAIMIDFTYKYLLWKEDIIVTYKFSQAQIQEANCLAANTFPEDFLFGIGMPTANEESLRESDLYCMRHDESQHTLYNVTEYTIFDSYFKYKENIVLARNINAKMFKISLSWTRILPHGFTNFVNQDAIEYYNNVINKIIASGMTPIVVLFDWILPNNLQLLGGCTNPMLAEWFQPYARIVFDAFGDRVKFWITINEANIMADIYSGNARITAINQSGITDYLCGHHMLLAHAKVYNMYNDSFRQLQNGKIGITQIYVWMELQNNNSQADIYGRERGFNWYNGWLTHPIFSKSGGYSKLMRDRINFKSIYQGFSRSRLPYFTDKEMRFIKGSADFLGINFYGNIKVRSEEVWEKKASFKHDADVEFISKNEKITPSIFGKLLERLNNDYILPEVYITENTYVDVEIVNDGKISDVNKIIYLQQHISQVMKAMQKGINIRGYLISPLIGDFTQYSKLFN